LQKNKPFINPNSGKNGYFNKPTIRESRASRYVLAFSIQEPKQSDAKWQELYTYNSEVVVLEVINLFEEV
jgi:hypothetical protein